MMSGSDMSKVKRAIQKLRREGAHQLSPSPGPVVVEQVVDPA